MELLLQLLIWAVGIFGGAKMVEKTLENFLMNQPWMPQGLKKWVVPVGTVITAFVMALGNGVPWQQAILTAITAGGAVDFIHDHPNLTSADWPLPPPPEI